VGKIKNVKNVYYIYAFEVDPTIREEAAIMQGSKL
jgi:hypothetical protein